MKNASFRCRSCGSRDCGQILSLGRTPLANSLLSEDELHRPEETYPLDLVFCAQCALVQITETVPPEKLFRNYLYFSSYSDTMLEHAAEIVDRMVESCALRESHLVVEIASNDGYLLQHYARRGIPVLGIEPAANIARFAQEERGIRTLCEFFGEELAVELSRRKRFADVIHANNVLAHVADLNGFANGIGILLKGDGKAVIEVPYVKDLVDRLEFDTIYHEHLCYFSLTSLADLFSRHGLTVEDVERLPIHGGSLRLFLSKRGKISVRVDNLMREEAEWGLDQIAFYAGFGAEVSRLCAELRALLQKLKGDGKRIAAYGASAKGSTLLNTLGIGRETLDFVADRSTVKQGYYTPGTHLPITAPDKLLTDMPDYVLLLAWNLADEVLEQQSEFRKRNGRFIVPIPRVCIV